MVVTPSFCFDAPRQRTGWTTPAVTGMVFDMVELALEACLQESGSCAAISEEYSGSGWRLHEPGLPMVDSDSTLIMRVNVSACAPPALPPPPLSPSWPPYLPLPAPPAPAWIPNPRRSGMEVFGLGVAAIILVVVVLTQFRYSG